jgi:hypothetical protein
MKEASSSADFTGRTDYRLRVCLKKHRNEVSLWNPSVENADLNLQI